MVVTQEIGFMFDMKKSRAKVRRGPEELTLKVRENGAESIRGNHQNRPKQVRASQCGFGMKCAASNDA